MNLTNPNGMTNLPVTEHLAELRRRLIIIIAALILGTLAGYWFVPALAQIFTRPIAQFHLQLAFFSLTGAFVTRVKLALIAATVFFCPLILYQALAFIGPGLRTGEKRFLFRTLFFLAAAFGAGVMFGCFLMIPLTLRFLITFGKSYLTPVLSGERYFSFFATLVIINGALFTLPILMIGLGKLGILNARLLKKGRKYVLGFLFIVEGLLGSLNDLFSLIMLALPLLVLYEISLWTVVWLEKKQLSTSPRV